MMLNLGNVTIMCVCVCVCVCVCACACVWTLACVTYLEWFGLSGHTEQCVDGE